MYSIDYKAKAKKIDDKGEVITGQTRVKIAYRFGYDVSSLKWKEEIRLRAKKENISNWFEGEGFLSTKGESLWKYKHRDGRRLDITFPFLRRGIDISVEVEKGPVPLEKMFDVAGFNKHLLGIQEPSKENSSQ